MKTKKSFIMDGDRYIFDFKLCTTKKGWAQIDTGQDAWYFGIWANPFKLMIVTYAEGDLIVKTTENKEEFVNELKSIKDFYDKNSEGFKGIDPGLSNKKLKQEFVNLGLESYLH